MGTLALSLGIMAIVGANWEDIPAGLKLAIVLGLNAACAVAVLVFWRRDRRWLREIAALLLFGLVLSGIALIGQVYQLQSAPWRALTLWLALCTPFLALTAYSRLTGTIWFVAAFTTWFVADMPLLEYHGSLWSVGQQLLMTYLAACAMIVVGILRSLWAPARGQGEFMGRLAWAGLIAACTLTVALDWIGPSGSTAPIEPILLAAVASVPAAIAVWFGSPRTERTALLALLASSLAVWSLGLLVSPMTGLKADLARALLFIFYWTGIGAVAANTGRRGLFGLALAMIGVRLLILYFEAIGGLTATGLGLIGGGVLCLVLAAVGWRVTRIVPRRSSGAVP
jgi:uncharacterized membrane protein